MKAIAVQVAGSAIGKAAASVTQALETWSKQVGLDVSERSALLQRVGAFAEDRRDELAAVHDRTDARAGDEDPIVAQLERLLDGRVTNALALEEWEEKGVPRGPRAGANGVPSGPNVGPQDGSWQGDLHPLRQLSRGWRSSRSRSPSPLATIPRS